MTIGWVAAVDLGATSGRVMLGHLGPDQLSVEAVHRFPNDPVRVADGLHWNILELYRNILDRLAKGRQLRSRIWPASASTPGRSTTVW